MKKSFVMIITFALSSLLLGQNINKVTIGSTGNSIKIKVTNPANDKMQNVSITIFSKPEWIEFEESNSIISLIEKNRSEYASFVFKVKNEVPAKHVGEIIFHISDNQGKNWTKKINIEASVPDKYDLEQNYPNPFNPSTKISFSLPKETKVKLAIFNVLGEEVKVLYNEILNAGNYESEFNASNLSSGVYFYRLETTEFTSIKKMMLLK